MFFLGFLEFYNVLPSFTGLSPDFTGLYYVLLGLTEVYRVFQLT